MTGQAAISSFAVLLHLKLQPTLRDLAMQSLYLYAAHFCSKAKYEEERNDNAYVSADCKIALVLKPVSAVEKDPGFKDLLRKTEAVVVECRKLLKIQTMKCAELNVKALQDKITGDFANALPVMAKLVIALEGIENAEQHEVVSDILKHNRDNATSFLNVSDPHFSKIHGELNGIGDILTPSNPPYSTSQPKLKHCNMDCLI